MHEYGMDENYYKDLIRANCKNFFVVDVQGGRWICECAKCGSIKVYAVVWPLILDLATCKCSLGAKRDPIHNTWTGMHCRCNNSKNKAYKYYGGRGIKVCERWFDFNNFRDDMGPRPIGMSLDRIDNNGNYSPDNCRWATRQQQSENRRNVVSLTYNGDTLTIPQWAEKLGISRQALVWRINHKGIDNPEIFLPPAVKHTTRLKTEAQ